MPYLNDTKKIKTNPLSPIYLLYGTESYFIQNLQTEIIQRVLPNGDQENMVSYNLEETAIQDVITDVETYPFFGEKKLIIAHNPHFLRSKSVKLPFEHDISVLRQYLEQPVDYTVLLFVLPYEKMDERKKIVKLIKQQGMVLECSPIREQDMGAWIRDLAAQFHITLTNDAYQLIEEELSNNLTLLQNEIKKLALFVGDGGEVTREIAERLLSHTRNGSALRMVDAVIAGDLSKAITMLKDLEKMKEEPIALVALLAFQFRTILQVKILKQKGYSQQAIKKQLGVHPYVVKIAYTRADKFTIQGLEMMMDKLTNADMAMKTGEMEKTLAMEMLIYELIHIS